MYESQYRLAAESEIVAAKCLDEPAWLPISEDICGQSVPIFGDSNCKLQRNVDSTSIGYVCKGKMCRRESQQHHTPVRLPQLASLLRAVLLFCSNEWMFCIETKMLKWKVLIGYHVFIISPPTCVGWQSASVSFLSTVIIIFPNLDFVTPASLHRRLHLVFMIAEKQRHFLY